MTNQEILNKAFQKAIDGGWQAEIRDTALYIPNFDECVMSYHNYAERLGKDVLFNHDFAKSIWPTQASGSVDPRAISPSTARPLIPTWQTRLMEMVVSEDPIDYLGTHI